MSIIIPANTLAVGGFNVANSVRLDGIDSSSRMEYTASNASNRRTWTWSAWIKRSDKRTNNFQVLFSSTPTGPAERIMFEGDKLTYDHDKAGTDFSVSTPGVLRDFSAWYHVVVMKDTTQSTETNRIKIYVNGVQQTLVEVQEGFPGQNLESTINTAAETQLFAQGDGEEFGGYACEVVFCDGQSLAADQFGEFDEDSGIWKPIDVSGLTFGTNGYYLNFADSSALGTDVSGNGNDYATANLAATDQSTDTCTNNFATWNALDNFYQSNTYSEGNLQVQTQSTSFTYNSATIGVSTGKWYWEVEYDAKSGGTDQPMIGITSTQPTANDNELGNFPNDFAWYTDNGTGYLSNDNTYSDESFSAYTVGNVISVALDLDNNKLYFAKNGTWEKSGNPESGSTGTGAISITSTASTPLGAYFPSVGDATDSQNATFKTNFGSPPFAISSGNADGNGFGNFEYAVPSGYFALCTKNLAEYG